MDGESQYILEVSSGESFNNPVSGYTNTEYPSNTVSAREVFVKPETGPSPATEDFRILTKGDRSYMLFSGGERIQDPSDSDATKHIKNV